MWHAMSRPGPRRTDGWLLLGADVILLPGWRCDMFHLLFSVKSMRRPGWSDCDGYGVAVDLGAVAGSPIACLYA
jgi:hypothetical protein